jgi:hypothetical protein
VILAARATHCRECIPPHNEETATFELAEARMPDDEKVVPCAIGQDEARAAHGDNALYRRTIDLDLLIASELE